MAGPLPTGHPVVGTNTVPRDGMPAPTGPLAPGRHQQMRGRPLPADAGAAVAAAVAAAAMVAGTAAALGAGKLPETWRAPRDPRHRRHVRRRRGKSLVHRRRCCRSHSAQTLAEGASPQRLTHTPTSRAGLPQSTPAATVSVSGALVSMGSSSATCKQQVREPTNSSASISA